jgi:CheY-like chemotaxis protein
MSEKIILHVEDDADEAFIVRRALEKAGLTHRIVLIRDGEQAIAYLDGLGRSRPGEDAPPPQTILLDLKLPGKDGFEVLAWIRSQEKLQDIPVVVLTSSDRPEDLRRAHELGITAYLYKSVSCRNLIEFLGSLA